MNTIALSQKEQNCGRVIATQIFRFFDVNSQIVKLSDEVFFFVSASISRFLDILGLSFLVAVF